MAAYCEVCSMTLNSVEQLSNHQLGKTHKKKIDSQNTEVELEAPAVNQGTKKKKKKKKLIDFVKASEPEMETTETPEALGFDINPEKDAQQPDEARGSKRKSDPGFCDICNKYLNSESQSEAHFSSAKHMKKAKLSTLNYDDPDANNLMAVDPVCLHATEPKSTPTSAAIVKNEPLTIVKDDPPTIATDEPPTIATDEPPTIATDESPTIATDEPPTLTHGFMFCSFCNLSLNSQSQIDAHRSGSKHKKKVAKIKGLQTAITSTT